MIPEENDFFFQHAPESRAFGDPIFKPGNGKISGPSKIVQEDIGLKFWVEFGSEVNVKYSNLSVFFLLRKAIFFWGSACHVRQGPSIQRLLLAHFGSPHELLVRMVEVKKKKKNQKKRRKYEYTANWSKSLGARFTHEPRAVTMKWWEPKRKCA